MSILVYLITIALVMVASLSALLTRSLRPRSGIDAAIVILLLIMMIAMLIGPAYLYLTTLEFTIGDIVEWEIAVFSGAGMIPIAILVAVKFAIENDPEWTGLPPLSSLLRHLSALRTSYVALLILSEVLMGWTFNIASRLVGLSSGYSVADVANEISYSLTTYWFVFTMVGEMLLTLLALRRTMRREMLRLLSLQAFIMLVTPTALPSRAWETDAFYLEAAAMTCVVAFAILHLRSRMREERDRPLVRYLGFFIIANALMMAGLLWWLVSGGETWILAPTLVLETLVYFDAVLGAGGLRATGRTTDTPSGVVDRPTVAS